MALNLCIVAILKDVSTVMSGPCFHLGFFFSRTRRRSAYQYIKKKVGVAYQYIKKVGENTRSTQVWFCFSGENKPVEINPLTHKLSLYYP